MAETAYEESLEAGKAVMNSLAKMEKQIQSSQRYDQEHKRAFRVAFNLLKELFPPKDDAEYWVFASKRVALMDHDNKDNPLCRELLLAVYSYLEALIKQERDATDEQCEPIAAKLERG